MNNIIFIEPVIIDDAVLEFYSLLNAYINKNTTSLVELPVISTENGPFRLVNNDDNVLLISLYLTAIST